jgi:3-deoxy-manno-octulosonate cytidylyltransferase (CMP-KDO synthetase)
MRIAETAFAAGAEVSMTKPNHPSGTDRVAEVAARLRSESLIINVQGDEPFLKPEQINSLISCFAKQNVQIVTLVKSVKYDEVAHNPNVVKAILDKKGCALYFSRAPVPFYRNAGDDVATFCWKHIGIYAYRISTLLQLVQLEPTLLEKAEMLEQLRWLEHGFGIQTCPTDIENISIDTPEDLLKIKN